MTTSERTWTNGKGISFTHVDTWIVIDHLSSCYALTKLVEMYAVREFAAAFPVERSARGSLSTWPRQGFAQPASATIPPYVDSDLGRSNQDLVSSDTRTGKPNEPSYTASRPMKAVTGGCCRGCQIKEYVRLCHGFNLMLCRNAMMSHGC